MRGWLAVAVLVAALGCGGSDEPTAPDLPSVAGQWRYQAPACDVFTVVVAADLSVTGVRTCQGEPDVPITGFAMAGGYLQIRHSPPSGSIGSITFAGRYPRTGDRYDASELHGMESVAFRSGAPPVSDEVVLVRMP